jgi:hypothetical protein
MTPFAPSHDSTGTKLGVLRCLKYVKYFSDVRWYQSLTVIKLLWPWQCNLETSLKSVNFFTRWATTRFFTDSTHGLITIATTALQPLLQLVKITINHHHHWLDSPTWALVCKLSFSIAKFLQFFTAKVLICWITSSSHLSLGLPIFLIPISLVLLYYLSCYYPYV